MGSGLKKHSSYMWELENNSDFWLSPIPFYLIWMKFTKMPKILNFACIKFCSRSKKFVLFLPIISLRSFINMSKIQISRFFIKQREIHEIFQCKGIWHYITSRNSYQWKPSLTKGHTILCNEPQRATTSHNEPQRTTTSHNEPQQTTTSHNESQRTTTSHNENLSSI